MTHQHKSNGREWLMVEVPEDATDIALRMSYLDYSTQGGNTYESLPSGKWHIHSDSLTITEEQAGEIVDKVNLERVYYKIYDPVPDKDWDIATATTDVLSSYRSLLRSLNINSRVINLVRI
jgi:hypothetical protein